MKVKISKPHVRALLRNSQTIIMAKECPDNTLLPVKENTYTLRVWDSDLRI